MKNLSLFSRLTLTFVILIAIFSLLISIFSYYSINYHYLITLTNHLTNNAYMVEAVIKPLIKNGDIEKIDSVVDNLSKNLNIRITVVDSSGKVLGDSLRDPKEMENHANRVEIRDAIYKGFGKSIRFSTTIEERMLYVAIPIKDGEKTIGVVRTSIFLKDIKSLLKDIRKEIFLSFLITLLIASLISILLTKILTKPLAGLKKATDEIAQGNFNAKIPESTIKEIKELSKNFENMALNIRELLREIEKERNELRTIIESMREALVVTDRKGKIILTNSSFRELAKTENLTQRYFWEVLRSVELKDIFEKITNSQSPEKKEIKIGNNFYLLSSAILSEEIIFVLAEITSVKQLEKTKKELITNISHELKTPLTAIKGFIETLEESINDPRSLEFINIIKRQTERLINILKDVLTLSRLEESTLKLNIEKVELNSLVNNVLKLFEKRIKDKNLKVEFSPEETIEINADRDLLEQLFLNLIENAINYTEKGKIGISMEKTDSKLKIEVFDTGIGIPQEHIPRIFERFYVVDKSRSKETGGTGLGLSIVKHIVLLHNGDIKVESKIGEGSKFIITLPLKG